MLNVLKDLDFGGARIGLLLIGTRLCLSCFLQSSMQVSYNKLWTSLIKAQQALAISLVHSLDSRSLPPQILLE